MKHDMKNSLSGFSRRDILRFSLASAGVYALGRFAPAVHAVPDNRKFVVLINLDGGNDSLNTVIPINVAAYYDRRANLAINNPLDLTSGPAATSDYGLHPNLSNLQTLHAEGSLAIIHKVGYPNANGSHFTSKDVYHTADSSSINANDKTGWIARYAELYNNQTMGCISIGYNAKALQGPAVNLLQARRLSSFGYNNDFSFGGETQKRLEVAKAMLEQYAGSNANHLEVKKAIQVGHTNIEKIETALNNYAPNFLYPNTNLGRSLEGMAQLIQEGGLGTDIYYTGFGGFDTHGSQGATSGRHPNLLTTLNQAVGAFVDDMKALGKWNDCVIVIFSEFGRRNFENGSGGTDHGKGQSLLIAGGAVIGGVYGSDLTDADLRDNRNMPMEVDFREIYKEVVNKHLGHDASPIFTDPDQISNSALDIL